jgi:hypothetical protein
VETLEGDPPPEIETAARGWDKGGGETRKQVGHPVSSKLRTLRQALAQVAESFFTIKGAHHADAPGRRRKTRAELIDGCEFFKLHDRRFPGKQAGRRNP